MKNEEKIRLGIYLNNANYPCVDFSHPENGNPGIRGTQYMIWMVACFLNERYDDLDLVMFANSIDNMPSNLRCVECKDEIDAANQAIKNRIEIFILKTTLSTPNEVLKIFEENQIKCITWSHNFENYPLAEMLASSSAVKCNVCVGRQQYERLRDHNLFLKSTYIYNALNFQPYNGYYIQPESKENIVTYVGALNEAKGFHKLAKNWKEILRRVPDAQLYVIGSGSLGSKAKLGPLGLAEEKYEKKFSKYICDASGHILESVRFMGNIGGEEQRRLMAKTKVGVANPTGVGETFCIVAIEFETVGVPVVSASRCGLLDTVISNQDGLLTNTNHGLVNSIVELLTNNIENKEFGRSGYQKVRNVFDINHIVESWHELIIRTHEDKQIKPNYEMNFPYNQLKLFRELNRKIKSITPLFKDMPSLLEIDYKFKKMIKRIIRR